MKVADTERFVGRGVPVVFFNRQVKLSHADCIGTDHARGARQLAQASGGTSINMNANEVIANPALQLSAENPVGTTCSPRSIT